MLAGCYTSHERAATDLPIDVDASIRSPLCPAPTNGDGRTLLVLHDPEIGPLTLSRREPDGTYRTITRELFSPMPFLQALPGGAHAVVGLDAGSAELVELETGVVRPLASLLPPDAVATCGRDGPGVANGFVIQGRADGRALLYGCSRYADGAPGGEARIVGGAVWEVSLESFEAREVATGCAKASYPVGAPCDVQVTWRSCPGSDAVDAAVRSELRRIDGSVHPLRARSWALSPSTQLALGDGDAPHELLVIDAAGRERRVLESVDVEGPLRFGLLLRRDGAALVFDRGSTFLVTTTQTSPPLPGACSEEGGVAFVGASPDGALLVRGCSASARWSSLDLRAPAATRSLPELDGVRGAVVGWSHDGAHWLIDTWAAMGDEARATLVSRDGEVVARVHATEPELGEVHDVAFAFPAD